MESTEINQKNFEMIQIMESEVKSTDAEVICEGLVQNNDRISEKQNKKQLPKYLKADFI